MTNMENSAEVSSDSVNIYMTWHAEYDSGFNANSKVGSGIKVQNWTISFTPEQKHEVVDIARHVEGNPPLDIPDILWICAVGHHKAYTHCLFERSFLRNKLGYVSRWAYGSPPPF